MCWRSRNSWEWCLLGTLCQLTVCCLLPVQSGGPFRIAPQHSCFTPCPVCPSDCCPRQHGSPPRPVRGGRCYWSSKLRSPWSVPFILTTRLPPEEVALSRFRERKLKPGRLAHAHGWGAARRGFRPGSRELCTPAPSSQTDPCRRALGRICAPSTLIRTYCLS